MPTPDAEIDAAARRVFERLGLWKPGQMCDASKVECRHFAEPWFEKTEDIPAQKWREHEIPPPDWRDPAMFLRLLLESKIGVKYNYRQNQWEAMYGNIPILANDPRAALILALDH